MRKVKHGFIKIDKIKFWENSRVRQSEDVADLMEDIQLRGLIEPVGVRLSDSTLIYGNRRVAAMKKLGNDEIECDFWADVTDEDLLLANLAENLKRKNITTIEIGRICQILLKTMTQREISIKLGVSMSRVKACLEAYKLVGGTKFEKLVTYGSGKNNKGTISESLLWKIPAGVSRVRRAFTDIEWEEIFTAITDGKIYTENVGKFISIVVSNPKISVKDALNVLQNIETVRLNVLADPTELSKLMQKHKTSSKTEALMGELKIICPKLLV